jgi:lipopolysaccharide transport system permease protein
MQVTEITTGARFFPDLAEAWRHRALAVVFARRNLKIRYKQTILGRFWLVVQPLPLTIVLTVFLGKLLSVPSDGMPYALFAFCGTALWAAFQRCVGDASTSLVANSGLLSKVYFPRVLVPISAFLTAVIDAVPLYIVLLVAGPAFGLFPGWPILLSAPFLLLALIIALGIALWMTVLDALYRDVRVLIPFLLQLGVYISPIMYPSSIVPQRWQLIYHLNPFVGILEGLRWSVAAGAPPPSLLDIGLSVAVAALLVVTGLAVFAKLERIVVDSI